MGKVREGKPFGCDVWYAIVFQQAHRANRALAVSPPFNDSSKMKIRSNVRKFFLAGSIAAVITAPGAHSANVTWDSNTGTAGVQEAGGTFTWAPGDLKFWDGTANVSTNNDTTTDIARFGNGGTLASIATVNVTTQSINGLIFGATTTNGYTLAPSAAAQVLTIGNSGITVNSGAQATTVGIGVALADAQTWTNNSTALFTTNGGLNIGSNTLTFAGSGNFSFGIVAASVLSGTGGIVMNGTGLVTFGSAATVPVHTYSGGITVNSGTVMFAGNLPTSGNMTLNGGVYQEYFGGTVSRALGSGTGQIQITGGASGFSGQGGTATNFNIGGAGAALVWGSAFFNPSTFVLQAANAGVNTNGKMTLTNGIDLAGSNRVIASNQTTDGAATSGATINGVISNSIPATTAGFEKTGVGNVILGNAANTFNGPLTISGGWITAGANGALGNASATNTLIFNGGTLRANAAFTSAATRAVTMSATGLIDSQNFAMGIAGNIDGAGGLIKNGTGTLTLSGTNTYGGVTSVNAGTLAIAKEVSLYNGSPASWTAANVNIKSGAGIALNVDSTGAAGFTVANLDTLLGNISVAGTAASGLQAGSTVAIDTSTASGGTFTQGNAIANSTGAFGGVISFVKLGTGTLVLDKANTYTGTTTVSGGILQLNDGGAVPIAQPINFTGGTFAVNRSGTTSLGTNIPGLIRGPGSISNVGAGTLVLGAPLYHTGTTAAVAGNITLGQASVIQFSALDTTGAGSVTLSGVTIPVFGGLTNSGAARDLGTVINASYANVTSVTLNPQSGSVTYSGAIANGAAGMSLTKTGAGTQIFTGNNTYTGQTFLNGGTLQIGSGANIGKLSGTAGITFNGGTLQFTRSTNSNIEAINDSAPITSNGGTLSLASNDAGGVNATETTGSVELVSGQFNVTWTNAGSSGTTITLGSSGSGLTRTGSTSAVAFSISNTLAKTFISGQPATATNQIIGPWATFGTNANNQTDYATYNITGGVTNSNGIQGAGIAGSAETTWTDAASAYTMGTNQTLTGTRSITALRSTVPTSPQLTLATGANLETYGLLNAGANVTLTIAPGTGGVLTTPAGGGQLHIMAGPGGAGIAGGITISAPINDNGGNVALVKNGNGTLTLSGSNNYSGGTIVNSGTLAAATNANLGGAGGITVNGNASFSGATVTYARSISLNNNAILTFTANVTSTFSGNVTGTGGLAQNSGFGQQTLFTGTGNTFTGNIDIGSSGTTGQAYRMLFASLTDSPTANGRIRFLASSVTHSEGSVFEYTGTANLTIANRQFEIASTGATPTNGHQIRNNGTGSLSINTDLLISSTAAPQTLTLRGSNTASRFAGTIGNGGGSAIISLTKSDGGVWALGGTNTYSGDTNLAAVGTTGRLVFQGTQSLSPNTKLVFAQNSSNVQSVSFLDDAAGTINFNRPIEFGGNNTIQQLNIFVGNNNTANLGSSAGTTTGSTVLVGNITHTSLASDTGTWNINATGANNYRLQVGTITLNNLVNRTANNTTVTVLNPTSASMTVAAVTMANGNTGTANDGVPVLRLDGTTSDNVVSGTISNAADGPGFGSGQALSLQKQNTSTWTLNGSSTYSGTTTVSAGILVGTNPAQAFGTNLNGISIAGTGTLSLRNDSTVTFTNGTSAYNISNSASGATINVDRITGTGSNTISVGNLTTSSTAGTWALNFTGANGVSLDAGTLSTPASTVAATHTISNNIGGGGALVLDAIVNQASTVASPDLVFTGSGNTIVDGPITQTLSTMDLIKNGTGMLTLNGANTYGGITTINGGTLSVGGSISGSIVNVGNAAVIQGSGSVNSVVNVLGGGMLAPGNSIQSLAIGSLAMSSGSTFAYELNGDAAPGVAGDLAAINGNLELAPDNTTAITFTELGSGSWLAGEKLTIASYGGAWNGGLFSFGGSTVGDDLPIIIGGTPWRFDYNDTVAGSNFTADLTGTSYVTITAVPEPGAAASLLAGLGVLAFVRRRRA